MRAPARLLRGRADDRVRFGNRGRRLETEELRSINENESTLLYATIARSIGFALMAVPLFFLFKAAQARTDRVRGMLAGLVVLGPVILAVQGMITWSAQTDVAPSSSSSRRVGDIYSLAENLREDSGRPADRRGPAPARDAGADLLADLPPLWAVRTGLLTRFFGTLGMALGASLLFILQIALLAVLCWLVYFGLLLFGRVPAGRPPAWDAGEAIPGRRRARSPWPPPRGRTARSSRGTRPRSPGWTRTPTPLAASAPSGASASAVAEGVDELAVTGAAGDFGDRDPAVALADERVDEVIGIDLVPPRLEHGKLTAETSDVRSGRIAELVAGCEAVIHLAFVLIPGRDRAESSRVNQEGSRNVLEACAAAAQAARRRLEPVGIRLPPRGRPAATEGELPPAPDRRFTSREGDVERMLDRLGGGAPESGLVITRLQPGSSTARTSPNPALELMGAPLTVLPDDDGRT